MPLKDKAARKAYRQGYWKNYYSDPIRKARHLRAVRKNAKKRRISWRKWIDDYKMERGCQVCGFREHPSALDLHHRDSATKEAEVAMMVKSCWSMERIKAEVSKCDVLCSNHHRIHHAKELGTLGEPARPRLPVTEKTTG